MFLSLDFTSIIINFIVKRFLIRQDTWELYERFEPFLRNQWLYTLFSFWESTYGKGHHQTPPDKIYGCRGVLKDNSKTQMSFPCVLSAYLIQFQLSGKVIFRTGNEWGWVNYCVSGNRSSLKREDIMRKSTTLIEGVSLRLVLRCFTCYYMKIDDPSGGTTWNLDFKIKIWLLLEFLTLLTLKKFMKGLVEVLSSSRKNSHIVGM